MFSPVRQPLSLRPTFSPGLIASAAVVSVMFAATAFLFPPLVERFGLTTAQVGLYSTVQVAAFSIASFGAGRLLRTSRAILVLSALVLVVANFMSGLAPGFTELVAMRGLAGLAAGTINWIAWAEAARQPAAMGRVAAIGPVAAAAGSIAFAPLIGGLGYESVFFLLAILGGVSLLLPIDVERGTRVGRRVSDSRSNLVLLVAMAGMTLFGSAAFVFIGLHLEGIDAPDWVLSAAMTGNALFGIAGTRVTGRRAWPWFVAVAVSVAMSFVTPFAWLSVLGLWLWGFAFWVTVPKVLRLLEDRSDRPGERTGDAQGIMAVGRIVGPVTGGGLEAAGGFVLLGTVSAIGIAASGAAVGAVERFRAKETGDV